MRWIALLLLPAALLLAVACQEEAKPEPAATTKVEATVTPVSGRTEVPATPTPKPAPSNTPAPPPATDTPKPPPTNTAVPPPPPTAAPAQAETCSPSYPGVCIPPPPPDLDCGDISYRRFRVLPPDPHRFDGDHDGIGCESG